MGGERHVCSPPFPTGRTPGAMLDAEYARTRYRAEEPITLHAPRKWEVMLVRRIARPLVASSFISEGWDAVRTPTPHVDRVEAAWARLGDRVDLPAAPSRPQMTTIVRAHGAAMVGAATLLALGRAPRTSAFLLVGLTLPVVASELPSAPWPRRSAAARDRSVTTARGDRLWRPASMLGAALRAAVDHEGRPGMAWRVDHARQERAAARATDTE